jgi:hypothetical protein
VGTFCYPTRPKSVKDTLEFEVWADLPRVKIDPVSGKPSGALFYRFKDVGRVLVSVENGAIRSSVGWRETRTIIREKLDKVEKSVEEAILRTGADQFSRLPFSEHMHTPLVDILSNLVYKERIDLSHWTQHLPLDEDELKFSDYVGLLEKADLVRTEAGTIVPGNVLLSLLEKTGNPPELVRHALSHFFKVEDVDSARRVIGPQLRLASKIYEAALEWGPENGYDADTLQQVFVESYSNQRKKVLQFPRYLLQLEQIGLVHTVEERGARIVKVEAKTFRAIERNEDWLKPFRRAVVRETAA